MKRLLKYIFILCAICPFGGADGASKEELQIGPFIKNDWLEYYNIPSVKIDFQHAPLHEVVNILAMASGINYQLDALELPTISTQLRMNPFRALELITERNNLYLKRQEDVWFIGRKDESARIQKTYHLKNVHLAALNPDSEKQLSTPNTYYPKSEKFSTQASDLIKEVGNPSQLSYENVIVEEIQKILSLGIASESKILQEAYVSYEADTNALYVVGTPQQHEWIESYLTMIDREVPNIEIKIMFLSSQENPKEQFGIDWSGMLGDGYALNISGFDDKRQKTPTQWGSLGNLMLPSTAILSTAIFDLKLKALEQYSHNRTKKYPLVTTYSNREVILSFTKNEPVVALTSDTQIQTSANTIGSSNMNTRQITQEEIGTVVRLLPRYIDGNRIAINIDIGMSNILGVKHLEGNEYPIISQTRYQGQTVVESGFTIVVGGLEETICQSSERGVNYLKDIPFFGWLFKERERTENKQKLSLYISVRLLDAKGNELRLAKEKKQRPLIKASLESLKSEVSRIEKDLIN